MVAVMPPALLAPDTDYLPTKAARRAEARAYRELVRLFGRRVRQPEPGLRAPVVLVPGFIAGEASLGLVARTLRRQGHRTFRSGVGANLGCTDDMVRRLVDRIEEVARAEGSRVALVGHSRGGMLAKLAAIRRPDLVAGVVVLSAPVAGTLRVAPHVRKQLEWLFRLNERGLRRVIGADCVTGTCASDVAAELSAPFPAGIPYTSVWSKDDGVIDWHCCLDPDAELVEVDSGHNGMGVNATVLRIVRDRLAPLAAGTVTAG